MAIGAVAAAANAAWYASEGDYFSAVTSLVSVCGCAFNSLSVLSDLKMLSSFGCQLTSVMKYASCVGNIAIAAYDIAEVGKTVYNLAAHGELTLGKVFANTACVVMDAVAIGGSIGMMSEKVSYCFVAGTPVATEDGQKPIEEIEVGDKVLSEDTETGEVAVKTVTQVFVNETEELVHVTVNGETISATPSHPFYVPKFGWTKAINLRAGDILVLSNGEYVVVEAIQHEILESPLKVYNFEVEDFHTYFVGESCILVHNKCTDTFDTWLDKGDADNQVYFGVKDGEYQYTGITNQSLDDRLKQHNYQSSETAKTQHSSKNFSNLEGQASGLTRNQARAIEQYYIENGPNKLNQINSIKINHRYHDQAMKWAEEYIKTHDMKIFVGGDFKIR